MTADSILLTGLLLVVAIAAGWFMGRMAARRPSKNQRTVPPAEFYRGLNHVLRDESDQALASLQSMAKADSGLVEIHFALGTLFRQRGETDRAIRIHQNLLARPDLAKRHHDEALYALAEDYLKAGLFDRAEALFGQLVADGVRRADSLQRLVSIYERQRDWRHAIGARSQLAGLKPGNHNQIIAHYYCELAREARKSNDLAKMRKILKDARRSNRTGVRGAMMRADLAVLSGNPGLAVRLYRRVLEAVPGMAWIVLPRLLACFEPDSPELDNELREAQRRQPELTEHLARAALATDLFNNEVVRDATTEFIDSSAALKALSENHEDNYAALAGMLHSLGLACPSFRCRECGYAEAALFWQCPGCQAWESGQSDIRLSARPVPAT